MPTMRLLLDTNVLIDYFARREPYFDDVVKLQAAQLMGDVELWIAPHALPDASYILRKAIDPMRLQEMIEQSLTFLTVSSGAQDETRAALAARWPDFEDSFVSQCAKRVGADYIITRNTTGFAASEVPTLSPAGFVALMEREHGVTYDVADPSPS